MGIHYMLRLMASPPVFDEPEAEPLPQRAAGITPAAGVVIQQAGED